MNYPNTMALSNIVKGRNPRDFFDPDKMAELESSAREHGIIQSVLLRPFEGKFQIVAGERRCRAALTVFGETYEIPVLIKELTDSEVDHLALIENIQRAEMSATEEAVAAAKVLMHCRGDHEETAKCLGWSRSTLDKRLALMNCSKLVKDALNQRKIDLGHAELLAAVTTEIQDKVVSGLLITKVPVSELKAMLLQVSKQMGVAIFDKQECTTCQHNSDQQTALFSESVGTGCCTNGVCYDKKTEEELVKRQDALKSDFPRVEIVRPGDNFKVIKLVVEGPKGVGTEQASACRGCANFGAAVSAVPDKLGLSYADMCYDKECNSQKVAINLKAVTDANKPAALEQKVDGAGKKVASTTPKTKVDGSEKAKPAVTVVDSPRVKEYRVKQWRAITKKVIMANPAKAISLLIGLAMNGQLRHVKANKLADGVKTLIKSDSKVSNLKSSIILSNELVDEHKQVMLMGIGSSCMDDIEERELITVMKFLEVDLKSHWKLNQEFFDLLTKSEMSVVAEKLGLAKALGDQFSKTMKLKNDEIVKTLLSVKDFEYAGLVPDVMLFN
jgi:ParB family chromosome partitioning protein